MVMLGSNVHQAAVLGFLFEVLAPGLAGQKPLKSGYMVATWTRKQKSPLG
jgi:hypothetical protein